jgi:hypothetical protein
MPELLEVSIFAGIMAAAVGRRIADVWIAPRFRPGAGAFRPCAEAWTAFRAGDVITGVVLDASSRRVLVEVTRQRGGDSSDHELFTAVVKFGRYGCVICVTL